MPPHTRSALARYLDRVRRLYPLGVPRAALRPPTLSTLCSLVVVTESPALSGSERELLEAICVKGLRCPFERCAVTVVRPRSDILEALKSIEGHHQVPPPVTIVFGAEGRLGELQDGQGQALLHTHPLERIGSDQAAKRETWGHLKAVLPHFSAQ